MDLNKHYSLLILSAPESHFRDALIMGQGLPLEKDGHPIGYRWKEVLRPGAYLDKNKQPFEITPKRINNLVLNFNRAKAKGFKPWVPNGHTTDATKNLGYLVDARTNDRGGLELLHQLIGEDAILAASRNGSSIYTVRDFEDETGEKYDELIFHNAICPDPQLSNLDDFKPALAASRAATESAVILSPAADYQRSPSMDITKLREAIGAAKEVTDEQVVALACTRLSESKTALELSRTKQTELDTELATLRTAKTTAETKVLELSRTPDVGMLADVADIKSQRIDLALERGQCTKAQADMLKASLKDGDKPAVLMLSKSGPHGTPVDLVLKVLELNKPFMGTVTGLQQVPDPNNPNQPLTAERKKEMLAHAGL